MKRCLLTLFDTDTHSKSSVLVISRPLVQLRDDK